MCKQDAAPRVSPYVVSADIQLLLGTWAKARSFTLPDETIFRDLREEFCDFSQAIFSNFELVMEEEISYGLRLLTQESGLAALSLDRVYFYSRLNLDITRYVDFGERNIKDTGQGRRPGSLPLKAQFKRIKKMGIKEVILVDDVLFTGSLMEVVLSILSKMGIKVPVVCVGIGVREGIERLKKFGIEVKCVRRYESVVDEICERDFYPGVPLSGRLVKGKENIGAPYILPFGDPEKWASIPRQWAQGFSQFCLKQTIKLYEAIEQSSDKIVLCEDLGRKVVFCPDGRFVDRLKKFVH
jgi:hypothetical protein